LLACSWASAATGGLERVAKSTAKQGVTDGESGTGPLDGVVCCVYKTSQQCIQHLHATFSLALPLMVSLTVTLTLLTSGLLSHREPGGVVQFWHPRLDPRRRSSLRIQLSNTSGASASRNCQLFPLPPGLLKISAAMGALRSVTTASSC